MILKRKGKGLAEIQLKLKRYKTSRETMIIKIV